MHFHCLNLKTKQNNKEVDNGWEKQQKRVLSSLYIPYERTTLGNDVSRAWKTTWDDQRTEYHSLTRRPCKGRHQREQPLAPNATKAPLILKFQLILLQKANSSFALKLDKTFIEYLRTGVKTNRKLEKILPFTSMIWGLSPGAWVLDMTVTAETCAIDRTVAAHIQGAPMKPQPMFNTHKITMSKWKPEPFFNFRSFLSIISSVICVSMKSRM